MIHRPDGLICLIVRSVFFVNVVFRSNFVDVHEIVDTSHKVYCFRRTKTNKKRERMQSRPPYTTVKNGNAVKEGLKRAQAFGALHRGCGLLHFCTTVDIADGDYSRLSDVMEGVNKDRKAAAWGKVLLTFNDNEMLGLGHVPADLASSTGQDVREWIDGVLESMDIRAELNGPFDQGMVYPDDNMFGFIIHTDRMDPTKEVFPFKLCDAFVQKSIDFLKSRGLFPVATTDGEEAEDFSTVAGIEW